MSAPISCSACGWITGSGVAHYCRPVLTNLAASGLASGAPSQSHPAGEKPAQAATAVSLTPAQAAWATFCLRVHANAPRDLRALNSPQALSGRACDIDALILAAKDLFISLVEDTAAHVNANPAALVRTIDAHMDDMAGDVRGALLNAIHGSVAA